MKTYHMTSVKAAHSTLGQAGCLQNPQSST